MEVDAPSIILCPSERLDEVLTVMKDIASYSITILVVTQEMSFAKDGANKVICMNGGVVVEGASPEEIFTNPKEGRTRHFLKRVLPEEYTYHI